MRRTASSPITGRAIGRSRPRTAGTACSPGSRSTAWSSRALLVRGRRAVGGLVRPCPRSGGLRRALLGAGILVEKLGEPLGVHDGDGAPVIASDVVADADRSELDRRILLDLVDHLAQVLLEVVARIDRERGIVDRCAIGDHHQDAPLLAAGDQAVVRPQQRLAVDVLLEDTLAQHEAQTPPRAAPGRVGRLVDDVAEIVEPAGIGRLPRANPLLARLPTLPGAGGETEDLHLDAAALERAGEDIGAHSGDRDRPSAHGAGIVDQQRHNRVAEIGLLLALVRERIDRIGDDARETRRVEDAFLEVELPGAGLLGEQPTLQPVGEPRDHALQMRELLIEQAPQPRQLLGVAEVLGVGGLVELRREGPIGCGILAGVAVARENPRPARAPGILVACARHELAAHLLGTGGVAVLLLAFGNARFERALRARDRALAGLVLALGVPGLLAFAFLVVALAGGLGIAQVEIEILDQLARGLAVGVLILDHPVQIANVTADLAFEEGPPQIDQPLGSGRRRRTRQLLAGQEPDRLCERAVAPLGEAVVALAAVPLVQHGREIGGDPAHAPGAQRLDPRLLDSLEDRARHLVLRQALGMELRIVIAEPERERVGGTAHQRSLVLREVARRHRQPRARARESRRLWPIAYGHVVALRDRTKRRRGGALEVLDRRGWLGHACQPGLRPASPAPRSP